MNVPLLIFPAQCGGGWIEGDAISIALNIGHNRLILNEYVLISRVIYINKGPGYSRRRCSVQGTADALIGRNDRAFNQKSQRIVGQAFWDFICDHSFRDELGWKIDLNTGIEVFGVGDGHD